MKKLQSGFTVVEGLLILVIVGLLGGTGWYVWSSNKQVNKNLDSATNTSQSSPTAKKASPVSQQDFVIKEWGVHAKILTPLTLEYRMTDGNIAADFSSKELDASADSCVDGGYGGFIVREKANEDHHAGDDGAPTGQTAAEYAKTLKPGDYGHVGDYYFFYTAPQGACSADKHSQDLQGQTHDAVLGLLPKLATSPAQ